MTETLLRNKINDWFVKTRTTAEGVVGIMRRLLRRYEINQKKNIIQASRNDECK